MTKDEAAEQLRNRFPKGATVYTILRHASASGMTRHIGVVSIEPGAPVTILHPNYAVSALLGSRVNKAGDGVIRGGAGMDVGFDLAYSLGQALYGDGYALRHSWL